MSNPFDSPPTGPPQSPVDYFAPLRPDQHARLQHAEQQRTQELTNIATQFANANVVALDTRDIKIQEQFEQHKGMYVGGVRIPSYMDRYYVFDARGRQMFNENGEPLDIRKLALKPGKPSPDSTLPTMMTIDGKRLVPDTAPQSTTRSRIAGKLYRRFDQKWNFQADESAQNAHNDKYLKEVVATGPDNQERALLSFIQEVVMNPDGTTALRTQNYAGSSLTPMQIEFMKEQIRIAKVDKGRFMAVAAYELGKREEQEQGGERGGWLQIVNFMHTHLGYSKEDIMSVAVGLQYMKKGSYLSFKHHGLELVDSDGNIIDEDKYTARQLDKMRDDGLTHYRFGKLKEREYAIELADKVVPYQFTFSPADVAETVRLAERVEKRLEANAHDKNGRQYQADLYILQKLKFALDGSRMAPVSDPTKSDDAYRLMIEQQMATLTDEERKAYDLRAKNANQQNTPRISGSSTAVRLWQTRLAPILDRTADKNPLYEHINLDLEYPSLTV